MQRLIVGLVATLLLSGLQLVDQDVAQAQETSDSCSNAAIGASSQDVGGKQVVISVHGLGSKPATWGIRDRESYEGSIHQTIDSIESDTYYYAFDYSERNQFWVTDPAIGPKLADTIVCLAQLSRDGGGIGEVVLVTHSMGGLAAKLAASLAPGDVGLVANVGTPHKGSFYANAGSWGMDKVCSGILRAGQYLARLFNDAACDENAAIEGLSIDSDKLGELPNFPDDVSVKAIAGNVTRQLKFGRLVLSSELNSDLVVPTYSAKDVYTNNGDGDGVEEVGCTGFVTTPVVITDASCAHTKMLRDPDVRQLVKESIEAFIAANQPEPAFEEWIDAFGILSIPVDNIELGSGIAEPYEMNLVDFTNCDFDHNAACPHVHVYDIEAANGSDYYNMVLASSPCIEGGGQNGNIGGEDAQFNQYTNDGGITSYCWINHERGLFITAKDALEGGPIDISLWEEAFAAAEWL